MSIFPWEEEQKLREAQCRPCLWFTPFPVVELLRDTRRKFFGNVHHEVEVYAVNRGPLACICYNDESATIYVHQVLNHSNTPRIVFDLVCKHELLHIRIPPREVEGKERMHPPEFWEAEKELCPGRKLAWAWIWRNLWDCLRRRLKLERVDVLKRWKKIWFRPMSGLEDVLPLMREPGKWEEFVGRC